MDERAFQQALREAAEDRQSGAGALARRCLEVLAQSAESAPAGDADGLATVLRARADTLAAARPSMAPVANLVGRWRTALAVIGRETGSDVEALRRHAAKGARTLAAESEAAAGRAAARTCEHLRDRLAGIEAPVVLTLSWSAVVAETLAGLKGAGVSVWVSESRPLNEGAKLAGHLAGEGLDVTLITDAQMAQAARVAAAGIMGADTLFDDGTAVNKTGSLLMALALQDVGKPLIAACESFKTAPAAAAAGWMFEDMDAAELGYGGDRAFSVRNVYFEAVPARLIDAWATENGVAETPDALRRLNPVPA